MSLVSQFAIAFILSLGIVAIAGAEAGRLPSATTVFEEHVVKVGGPEKINDIESIHVSGTYTLPALELKGSIDLYFARPEQLLFAVDLPGVGQIRRGYDGSVGWSVDPQRGAVVLSGLELGALRKQAARGFSLLPDPAIYSGLEIVGKAEFEGEECYQIKLSFGPSDVFDEYYSVATGLLVGRIESFPTPQGATELWGKIGDYRDFSGLTIATEWIHRAAGQEWTAVYETVEINQVDGSIFSLPSEIRRLLEE